MLLPVLLIANADKVMPIKGRKRPMILTVALVIGIIAVVVSFPNVFSPFIKRLGDWFPALFGSLISLRFIALVGVWHMKKWGVRLFLIVFIVYELINFLVDDLSYFEVSLSGILAVVFISFYNRMDDNL